MQPDTVEPVRMIKYFRTNPTAEGGVGKQFMNDGIRIPVEDHAAQIENYIHCHTRGYGLTGRSGHVR